MKVFACVVLLAVAAFAAPEGKRDKRGFLLGGLSSSYDLGHSSYDLGLSHGFDEHISYSAPAKIISSHKIVEVPKIVEVKKVVSVPKIVSVPQIVKVSKIVEDSHYVPSLSQGWW
ncbi:unnamed protein product [Danaus chrysippus]|uniref:(African queen) hypothetical protein n=1 Tax=Danaus chrysippus TaxID=151541 RepID=A0A8J2W9Y3_9NEOP|nr:unnamed protein product [Danaus chrysippus]